MSDYSNASSESSRPDPGDTQSIFRGLPARTTSNMPIVQRPPRVNRGRKRTTGTAGLEDEELRVYLLTIIFVFNSS